MLSVFARPCHFKLNKLLEPARLNLLLPKQNLNRTQLQSFRTRRDLQDAKPGRNPGQESNLNQWLDSKLVRATASAIGGSLFFYAASAVWSYEKLKYKNQAYNFFNQPQSKLRFLPPWVQENGKLALSIIALNLMVFAAWRVPKFEPFMLRYFTLSIGQKSPTFLPMLLSTFSHHSLTHLFFNMVCLQSFAIPLSSYLGNERLLALYLSAGMFGSLASIILKIRRASLSISLGASAAILGLFSFVCVLKPDSQIAIIFLPMFPFSAQNALIGLLAVDLTGLLMGWRLFDHAGHLGGTLFGIWYATPFGQKLMNEYRKKVARIYHQIKSPKKN